MFAMLAFPLNKVNVFYTCKLTKFKILKHITRELKLLYVHVKIGLLK